MDTGTVPSKGTPMTAAANSYKKNLRMPLPSTSFQTHTTRAQLLEMGKSLRAKCPRKSHAVWVAPDNRPDPLTLLQESTKGRIPQRIPVRHGRMIRSPFAWFRGAALQMAAELASTPVSGLRAQACGDAHLSNFGAYATPPTSRLPTPTRANATTKSP